MDSMPSIINVQEKERWASALGGAALIVAGAQRLTEERPGQAALLGAVGAGLIWRGSTGHCGVYEMAGVNTASSDTREHLAGPKGVIVEEAVAIERPREELYRTWRRFERLPAFMPPLLSVEAVDHRMSRWVARGPAGMHVEWTLEIIND